MSSLNDLPNEARVAVSGAAGESEEQKIVAQLITSVRGYCTYTLSHPRTTMTSARIPDKYACHRTRNLCVFSRVQKGLPGLMHKGCALQRVSLGTLSDVTVVLGMRQSI